MGKLKNVKTSWKQQWLTIKNIGGQETWAGMGKNVGGCDLTHTHTPV